MNLKEIKKELDGISHWPFKFVEDLDGWHAISSQDDKPLEPRDLDFLAKAPEIIDALIKQNEIMREALEYYADRNNWSCRIYGPDDFNNLIDRDEDGYFQRADEMEVVKDAGEKAREVLKEIKE